jgi:hypothetical protein
VIFAWIGVTAIGAAGFWIIWGDRIRGRGSQSPPVSSTQNALGLVAAAVATIGLALAVLVGIDSATVKRNVDCIKAVDPSTGDSVLSCGEEGGLDWLPRWIRGGTRRR